jgi:hypothetical protein
MSFLFDRGLFAWVGVFFLWVITSFYRLLDSSFVLQSSCLLVVCLDLQTGRHQTGFRLQPAVGFVVGQYRHH